MLATLIKYFNSLSQLNQFPCAEMKSLVIPCWVIKVSHYIKFPDFHWDVVTFCGHVAYCDPSGGKAELAPKVLEEAENFHKSLLQ